MTGQSGTRAGGDGPPGAAESTRTAVATGFTAVAGATGFTTVAVAPDGRARGDAEDTARRRALAGLLRCCEPPVPAAVLRFLVAEGPEQAWDAIARRCAPAEVGRAVEPRLRSLGSAELDARARDDLRRARAAGAELVGPGDPDWPEECFAGLEGVAPYDKCRDAAPPIALYRRGGQWPVRTRASVAVVGSRSATPYGIRVATEMGAHLSGEGFTVVSGAAFGVDAAAHRGALRGAELQCQALPGGAGPAGSGRAEPAGRDCAGGVTVAVLACGIDRSYPVAHRSLLDAAASCGAVVSEYPPGSVPARHRFLVRNRLIAAMAEGTVVVEAGRRSGSLNTATTAGSLLRQVLAVPGPVTSAMSVGCHDLIRQGKAELATDARDVIGLLGPLRPAEPVHRRGERPTDGLDLITSRVHDALPARGAATADDVSTEAGLPVRDVLAALATLQIDGLAQRVGASWRRA